MNMIGVNKAGFQENTLAPGVFLHMAMQKRSNVLSQKSFPILYRPRQVQPTARI